MCSFSFGLACLVCSGRVGAIERTPTALRDEYSFQSAAGVKSLSSIFGAEVFNPLKTFALLLLGYNSAALDPNTWNGRSNFNFHMSNLLVPARYRKWIVDSPLPRPLPLYHDKRGEHRKQSLTSAINSCRSLSTLVVQSQRANLATSHQIELYWNRLGELSSSHDGDIMLEGTDVLRQLRRETLKQAHLLSPTAIVNVLIVVDKLVWSSDSRHNPQWHKLEDVLLSRIDAFRPQQFVEVTRAFAEAGLVMPRFFLQRIQEQTVEIVRCSEPKTLELIAWTFAQAGVPAIELFMAILENVEILGHLTPQLLAYMALTCAKRDVPAPELFALIANELPDQLTELDPHDFTNLASAYAITGVPAPNLFEKIAGQAVWTLGKFQPHQLIRMAWAYARAEVQSTKLFAEIAEQTETWMQGSGSILNPLELSDMAWAYAKAATPVPTLFDAMAEQIEEQLGKFSAQQITKTVLAYAKMKVAAPTLFAAIADELEVRVGEFKSEELVVIAKAYAKLGMVVPEALMSKLPTVQDDAVPTPAKNWNDAFRQAWEQVPVATSR